jgi:hypothetical protein
MGFRIERQQAIFDRTQGRCHICRKRLAWSNYGVVGARGAWEVEHSVPQAYGGTHHMNNLYAACIPCNRSKGAESSRWARGQYGYTAAPHSVAQELRERQKNARIGAIVAGGLALLARAAPPVALLAAGFGALAGHSMDLEE